MSWVNATTSEGFDWNYLATGVVWSTRFLQDNATMNMTGNLTGNVTGNSTLEFKEADFLVLRNTLRLYGSIFALLMLIFAIVRVRYPKTYNVRSWVEDLHCKLADTHYGALSWAWMLWSVDEDDFRDQCGMDSLCFVRIMQFGLKIAFMGMFNSLWLVPMYLTAKTDETTVAIEDPVVMSTIAHVPLGSKRMIGTVLAVYIMFAHIFSMLLREFEWFTEHRHKYLMRKVPQNYSVYVAHIPEQLRGSHKLLDFFRASFSVEAVLEAHNSLQIPNLEGAVAARDAMLNKLEHAINIEDVKGKTPYHREILKGNRQVNSIDSYTEQLREANEEVKERIEELERMHDPRSFQKDLETASHVHLGIEPIAEEQPILQEEVPVEEIDNKSGLLGSLKSKGGGAFKSVSGAAGGLASGALDIIGGKQDGECREAGFITFTKLSSTQAAMQMVHHPGAHKLHVQPAPEPEDIFWTNVGKSHYVLTVGKHISLFLTAVLCLFWTIPMAFFSSMSDVAGLTEQLPFLEDWLIAVPVLRPILAQIAPLLVVIFNSLLPIFLEFFSTFEGPISDAVLQTSVFSKLSAFMIIQTFFVTAIGGSISSELKNLAESPTEIFNILAKSLPGQSTFFTQMLLIQTFLGLGLEMLRVTPLAIALVRRLVGPNLTEKERNTTWFGLRPLADPLEFEFAQVASGAILYFMVQFVYSSTAPLTNWFMALCFIIMIPCYKHQFIYNYPTTPDSGGKIWTNFVKICMPCMLISQITLIGLLTLKQALIAGPMMFPLFIFTILFSNYLTQEHYHVTEFLPSRECLKMDLQNTSEGVMDYTFLKNAYLQPAMQNKEPAHPENYGMNREMGDEDVKYLTPPSSEVEILNDDDYYTSEYAEGIELGEGTHDGDVSTIGGASTSINKWK